MKKTLIAMAVLAASGASMAQSSVTLYGIADIWFGSTKSTVSGADAAEPGSLRQTVLESGGVSGSRWGVKGSEDLGGGLKANFNLEQGFDISTGKAAGVQFNRQAWVGVSGGFGDVKLGRTGTAYDDIAGTNTNTFDSALSAKPWVGYNGVVNNQIYYAFPSMGGVTGAVSYSLGEDKTATTSAGKIASVNVQYAAGPLMVGFAHQSETAGNSGLGVDATFNGVFDVLDGAGVNTNVSAAGSKAKNTLLTGSYDLGVAKLLASYNNFKYTSGADTLKAKEFQLGADIPLSSAATLAVGYGQSKWEADVNLAKATAFSAAVNYTLSKRTSIYAGFNNTKLKFDAAVADATVKSSIYAVGVRHAF